MSYPNPPIFWDNSFCLPGRLDDRGRAALQRRVNEPGEKRGFSPCRTTRTQLKVR
jgi:hypothetical protein